MENKKIDIALLILRVGLAIVFLLFGLQKLTHPAQTTAEIQLLLSFLGLGTSSAMNFYIALAEIGVALGLILGYKVRFFGLLGTFLTISFFGTFILKYGFSINPDLYRDIGLTAIGISLSILGGGKFGLDKKTENRLVLNK